MWNWTWEKTVTAFGWWELLCGHEDRRWDKIPDHITLMKTKTQHFISHSQLILTPIKTQKLRAELSEPFSILHSKQNRSGFFQDLETALRVGKKRQPLSK